MGGDRLQGRDARRWGAGQAGRAKLCADLTALADLVGCDCAKCRPGPLNEIEAQRALRHVSSQERRGGLRADDLVLVGFHGCTGDECDGWVPLFIWVV